MSLLDPKFKIPSKLISTYIVHELLIMIVNAQPKPRAYQGLVRNSQDTLDFAFYIYFYEHVFWYSNLVQLTELKALYILYLKPPVVELQCHAVVWFPDSRADISQTHCALSWNSWEVGCRRNTPSHLDLLQPQRTQSTHFYHSLTIQANLNLTVLVLVI